MPNPDAMLDTAIFYATQDSFLAESEGEAAVLLPPYERPETTPEHTQTLSQVPPPERTA